MRHSTNPAAEGVYRRDLMCNVRRLEYDFEARTRQLWLPPHNCTDMTGAINLFSAIDPSVRRIVTWRGTKRDTEYFRERARWESFTPPHGES